MIIYEVNLEIEDSIKKEFEEWLPHHMKELLKCDGFTKAEWYVVEGEKTVWSVHYHVKTRELLEDYLKNHAPRLRGDGIKRFGEKFRATRRVLKRRP